MSYFTQLHPSIPVGVNEKGSGECIGIIDYGPEHDLIWVVALDSSGEVWCTPNKEIRFLKNYSIGRHQGGSAKQVSGCEKIVKS